MASGWHRVTSGVPVEWMRTDYGMRQKTLRVAGWLNGTYNGAQGLGKCAAYLKSIGRLTWAVGTGVANTFKLYVDFDIEAINLDYRVKKTIYRKWDYDFISPPGALASNLLATQNWTPWEGPVVIIGAALDGYNGLRDKINLANAHPDAATMNALVRGVTYDGLSGRITWDLGAPPRTDLGGLVNKMRRNPQDNIVWL